MGIIVGIDIGGSTTKIVGLDKGKLFSPLLVKATDPLSSVYGALGKFLNENKLQLSDVDNVMVTGVGSSFIEGKIFSIPTYKVDEFLAIGRGGLSLSDLTRAIIVSMGTGTAYVIADGDRVQHIGGTGVGGGTLLGLSNRMLNIRNFSDLVDMAKDGNLSNVDLSIGDISHGDVAGLTKETTASNFGKISDLASKADIALGIINLVFQTIGMLAVFASRNEKVSDVVLTGNLTNVPQARAIFDGLTKLFNVNFHIPLHAEYATAAGAALSSPEK
ncbi:MAG TPA: type II pantothenate kinase [Clostridiaceae bacterium]|jgi:type II pantothenate kinase|nr:type II pantothenate kinase [Clostridiaceae bacterium]